MYISKSRSYPLFLMVGLLFVALFCSQVTNAQGTFMPTMHPFPHILDRLEIKTGIPTPYHSTLKYIQRGAATQYALKVDTSLIVLSSKDRFDLYYLFKENNDWLVPGSFLDQMGRRGIQPPGDSSQMSWCLNDSRYILCRKPILKYFYQTPANFLEVSKDDVYLRFNPLFNFQFGSDANDEQPIFFNKRGLQMRGGLDDRLYFYFDIQETQARFPNYINDRITTFRSLPGQGLYKAYSSDTYGIDEGYDFLNGQGYMAFHLLPHLHTQFGYGRNFIGNGHRSLLLSDFANNYLYLKLNWQVWKFHYQNIFAELAADSANNFPGEQRIPKKYMATHHLSIELFKNLTVGIFETIIFDRGDGFDLQYLNPIMFYRAIEGTIGSPDNVMIGIDLKWNFLKRFQLYSQFILDEFKFNELITDNQGWWANKFGFQAGLKYIDVLGIDHLDFQAEFNTIRPYMFAHRDGTTSYTHYRQPLAHPLGANFRETIFLVKYQPLKRLYLEGKYIQALISDDINGINYGNNLLLNPETFVREYGNFIGQGVEADLRLFELHLSYRIAHNLFADLYYFNRNKDSVNDNFDLKTSYFGGGLRLNINREQFDF